MSTKPFRPFNRSNRTAFQYIFFITCQKPISTPVWVARRSQQGYGIDWFYLLQQVHQSTWHAFPTWSQSPEHPCWICVLLKMIYCLPGRSDWLSRACLQTWPDRDSPFESWPVENWEHCCRLHCLLAQANTFKQLQGGFIHPVKLVRGKRYVHDWHNHQ